VLRSIKSLESSNDFKEFDFEPFDIVEKNIIAGVTPYSQVLSDDPGRHHTPRHGVADRLYR
jgi:hypothetical protein